MTSAPLSSHYTATRLEQAGIRELNPEALGFGSTHEDSFLRHAATAS